MSIWQKVKQELDSPMDMVKKGLTDALDSAEDLTRKGRLKLEIQLHRSDIRTQMTELGGRVFQIADEETGQNVLEDATIKDTIARIKELEQKISDKERELLMLKEMKVGR